MRHCARLAQAFRTDKPRGISAMNVQEASLRNAARGRDQRTIHSRPQFLPAAHGGRRSGRGGGGRRSRPRRALPAKSHRRGARAAAAGHPDPARVRRRRRVDLRHCRHVLRARPRLRLHRDDLRDASDQGRLPGPPRRRQRLARSADAPRRGRTVAAGVLDHGRPERRQHPLLSRRGRARRRPRSRWFATRP